MANKNIGIWIRVSTDMQVQGDSPEHHEQRARLYAEAKGWTVKKVYRLEALSGKSVMQYQETKQMLKDLREGLITGLIFSKLARLARNTKELLEISEIFQGSNADLISLSESIDTSTPAGRLFYTMIAAMAQWEREEIAERVAASVPIRARLGKPLGGQAPYGYSWDGHQLLINEQEAPIRKILFELFLKHKRKGTVAKELNAKGFRTRNGSLFTDTTIGRLLHDPMAKGIRRANYTKSLGEGKNWTIKPESEWIMIPCPAIVSEELWDECNKLLAQQERTNKKPAKKPVHLFTGIVYCDCGRKMYIPSESKKYCCSECKNNKIGKDDLEDIYYTNLKSFLITDEHLETILEKADSIIASKEEELRILNQDKQRLETEMDKLVQLHIAGEIPKTGFGKYFNPLSERVKQIEETVPTIQAEIDFLKIEYLNSDKLVHDAKSLYDQWPTLEIESKRTIVEQVTNKVIIGKNDINIKFSYTPTFLKTTPDSQRNFRDSYWQST